MTNELDGSSWAAEELAGIACMVATYFFFGLPIGYPPKKFIEDTLWKRDG